LKKKVGLIVAISLFISITLWIFGYSEAYHRVVVDVIGSNFIKSIF